MVNIHFISFDKCFIECVKTLFKNLDNVTFEVGTIENIDKNNKAFMSPANSLGFMDGGIDKVLTVNMFPGIEKFVKNKIKLIGLKTVLGRYYLPVGSALIIPIKKQKCCLISSPTMFLPHDVSTTKNAYYAFMAALMALSKYIKIEPNINTLVCTSLCCGFGKMAPHIAAQQIYDAYNDFINGNHLVELKFKNSHTVFISEAKDNEQPNNYDNREIKTIYIGNHIIT